MPFFEFLIWLNLGSNPGLPSHWQTLGVLGQWAHAYIYIYIYIYICNILSFNPAVNQETGASGQRYQGVTLTGWIRCNCGAQKKQVDVKQLYNQVPQTASVSWSSCCSSRQWEPDPDRGLKPSGSPVEQPSRMRKKCCLLLGVNMLQSVPSPTHFSHTTLLQPFRIKCEKYIFLKKCVRSSLLLILFPLVYIYTYSCIQAIQHTHIWCRDQDLGPEYGPFRVLRFFKELQSALLCLGGWKMNPYCTLMHTCQDSQPHKDSKTNLDNN